MNEWNKVIATHEESQKLSKGPWLGDAFPGAALPDPSALGQWIIIRYGDRWTVAQCMDVGPWCEDDPYWLTGDKPRAELNKGNLCPIRKDGSGTASSPDEEGDLIPRLISNGAGLDIFPQTAKNLGIPLSLNPIVEWKFLVPPFI